MQTIITINHAQQQLQLIRNEAVVVSYAISTAQNGLGERQGSGQTPRGEHVIHKKIGGDMPMGTVFVGREPTGEVYSPELAAQHPDRDWILTRILWLAGTEIGKNCGGSVDTLQRYIYIHGTPDTEPMGSPASHGCIRMHNTDVVELFAQVAENTPVFIQ